MKFDKTINGWSNVNERLYNELLFTEQRKLNKAMLLEIERNIPIKRKSFKELYFLTLNRKPMTSSEKRKESEMEIAFLQKEIDKIKLKFRLK